MILDTQTIVLVFPFFFLGLFNDTMDLYTKNCADWRG